MPSSHKVPGKALHQEQEQRGTFWNLWGSPASSARSKGYSQKSITYSMTPLLHTSASLPSYVLLFAMTSGAARQMPRSDYTKSSQW